uniref:DUF4283 domain-containing protein n=1 Tax=Cannabis sativa TaxID=3483 RepID=A0A803PU03_CANSA
MNRGSSSSPACSHLFSASFHKVNPCPAPDHSIMVAPILSLLRHKTARPIQAKRAVFLSRVYWVYWFSFGLILEAVVLPYQLSLSSFSTFLYNLAVNQSPKHLLSITPAKYLCFLTTTRSLFILQTLPGPFLLFASYCPLAIYSMDDLTNSLSVALNLTKTECTVQTLHELTPVNTPETETQQAPLFLVVKVHTVKSFNRKNFIEKMTKNWNHISRSPVIITERPHGLFLVEFGCDGDRRRVLLQQPWTYLNQAILMDIPNSLDSLNGDSLLKIPLWVQVFNTPFLKRSEELAAVVSSSLGHMLELYKPSLRETWGPYFRLRVMFDVAQPLPRGIPIHFSELRYDIKSISGKVKVSTNALLCPEQLNFANPPVAFFMTTNPASAVCVAPPESMPPFPTYGSQGICPTQGQTQQVGLFKSGPSALPQNYPQWNQPDPITNTPTPNPSHTLPPETITPTYTALLNATMSNTNVQKASPIYTPNHAITSQHSSGSNSTSSKYCHVPLPENIPLLDTSKRLEAMNLTYQPGIATPSGSKASRKRSKPDSKDKFKRQTEMVNRELCHQIKRSRSDIPQVTKISSGSAGLAIEQACPPP